jgi:hypothetical protein
VIPSVFRTGVENCGDSIIYFVESIRHSCLLDKFPIAVSKKLFQTTLRPTSGDGAERENEIIGKEFVGYRRYGGFSASVGWLDAAGRR